MKDVINELYLMRSDINKLHIVIKDNRAYLFCYRNYSNFRPQLFLNALNMLEQKLIKENLSLSSKLYTNFCNFILLGYPPSLLENLVDKKFKYTFKYVTIGGDAFEI